MAKSSERFNIFGETPEQVLERYASENALLLKALKLALPYVQKVAATAPTELERVRRQRQAASDAAALVSIIQTVEG